MSKIVGLTGGIATGKTQVSNYLKTFGIPIIDADIVTKMVEAKGHEGLVAIISEFGEDFLDVNGELDRKKLAQTVFSSDSELKRLVRVINPFIGSEIYRQINELKDQKMVVLDAPTLFENGYNSIVDETVVVYTDPVKQLSRLINRNQLSITDAMARINSQWSLETKRDLADVIIYNSKEFDLTKLQIDDWLRNEEF
ncbi:dephospho-CoA kinase [Lentilactobacillus curieae]|uniref:Dephospho-CoA kinase n=1 Tax=Lentilactobacillus curieae TaxID=1138822 RepID=A0A1S6QK13_9LACO|nr:dephospho-CoA kinase [Lentilactobacillus curieae]AQW21945.1 dephospho-CoA kinase [Lentilactobacillus curieae]